MKVCYFGFYIARHPRNSTFISALRQAGYEVEELHVDARPGVAKYVRLAAELFRRRKRYAAVVAGFPGPQAIMVARLVYRGPILFNALLSQYDAMVNDREDVSKVNLRAAYLWLVDFLAGHLATKVILDCDAYNDYYARTFRIPRKRFVRIFQSANEEAFKAVPVSENPLTVHYYSGFLPSHGTDVIVRAAALVREQGIRFVLSGNGPCHARDQALARELGASNVSFIPYLSSLDELNAFARSSWVSLGLFSKSRKADRAIATKVLEALYCGRPVVTGDTAGTRELLTDGVDALLVPLGDPEALAAALRRLKKDDALRRRIAQHGKKTYEARASIAVAAQELSRIISV